MKDEEHETFCEKCDDLAFWFRTDATHSDAVIIGSEKAGAIEKQNGFWMAAMF
jgi:hypothetical protein